MSKSDVVDAVDVTVSAVQHETGVTADVLSGFGRLGSFDPALRSTRSASKRASGRFF